MGILVSNGTKLQCRGTITTRSNEEFVANGVGIFNKIKEHLDSTEQKTTIDPIQFECRGTTDLEGNVTPCGEEERQQPFTADNSTF